MLFSLLANLFSLFFLSFDPKALFLVAYFCKNHLNQQKHPQQQKKQEVPSDFLKWASLGFCRGSRFATGFTPLQPKALESIIDIERAKHCSPEDLISIWDDVSSNPQLTNQSKPHSIFVNGLLYFIHPLHGHFEGRESKECMSLFGDLLCSTL